VARGAASAEVAFGVGSGPKRLSKETGEVVGGEHSSCCKMSTAGAGGGAAGGLAPKPRSNMSLNTLRAGATAGGEATGARASGKLKPLTEAAAMLAGEAFGVEMKLMGSRDAP
jgi:hypothetical protein